MENLPISESSKDMQLLAEANGWTVNYKSENGYRVLHNIASPDNVCIWCTYARVYIWYTYARVSLIKVYIRAEVIDGKFENHTRHHDLNEIFAGRGYTKEEYSAKSEEVKAGFQIW